MQSTLIPPETLAASAGRIERAPAATSAETAPRVRASVSPWRYELKYAVPRHAQAALLVDLHPYVEPDGHGDGAGCYIVHSVYFDSPDLACFRAKLDGLPNRFKLRVRSYLWEGSAQASAFKLEIKERDAERVRKIVTTMDARSYENLVPLLESFRLPHPDVLASSTALAQFFRVRTLHAMRAAVSVTYGRRAMIPRLDRRCRVTLDDGLVGAPTCALPCASVPRASVPLCDDAVLEIKTPAHVPTWLVRLIKKHRLQRCSCSKYALAVPRCLAVDA